MLTIWATNVVDGPLHGKDLVETQQLVHFLSPQPISLRLFKNVDMCMSGPPKDVHIFKDLTQAQQHFLRSLSNITLNLYVRI